MNTFSKRTTLPSLSIAVLVMTLLACGPAAVVSAPTATSAPTVTPAPTPTALVSAPTVTSALTPTALPLPTDLAPGLSEPPAGFNWQGVPGVSPAFLVPNSWYFTTELRPSYNDYYVAKEKIGAGDNSQYSTGLVISAIDSQDKVNIEFAKNLIDDLIQRESTKKVISSSQNEQGNLVSYQLLIEAEYSDVAQDSPNRKKTVFYTYIVDKTANILYLVRFESPSPIWDAEWKKGQLMIDTFVQQLTAETEPATQAAFTHTLANTSIKPLNSAFTTAAGSARPTGIQPAAQSDLFTTTFAGFEYVVRDPASGKPWQIRYLLDLEVISALPSDAVIQAYFENPLDTATAIVVRLYHLPSPSGSIYLKSPLLGGFKCQNYWVQVLAFSDATSQAQELGGHTQWINSNTDLDKVTSDLDFIDGNTC